MGSLLPAMQNVQVNVGNQNLEVCFKLHRVTNNSDSIVG